MSDDNSTYWNRSDSLLYRADCLARLQHEAMIDESVRLDEEMHDEQARLDELDVLAAREYEGYFEYLEDLASQPSIVIRDEVDCFSEGLGFGIGLEFGMDSLFDDEASPGVASSNAVPVRWPLEGTETRSRNMSSVQAGLPTDVADVSV